MKKLSLYYKVTPTKIYDPSNKDKKEDWIAAVKAQSAEHEPKTVKVTYEIISEEVERMRAFFEGPVVDWWAIQNGHEKRAKVRELLLDEHLGYDVELLNGRTKRERPSTTTWRDATKWYEFLKILEEDEFEKNGLKFPSSDEFRELKSIHGRKKAHQILVDKLQKSML